MQNHDPEKIQENWNEDGGQEETMDANEIRSIEMKENFSVQHKEIGNQKFVMQTIVNMGEDNEFNPLFEIKWYGYAPEENNWEPTSHIYRSHIARYCKRKGLDLPDNIADAHVCWHS